MAERKAIFLGLDGKELAVFAAYLAMVCFAILHYQPWEDEGRAWLDARNCTLYQLTFHVLRYEGHPALWYWILWPLSHLHVPFLAINWIATGFAASATFMLLRWAPFPFYLRALLPFTFALGYEYAVVGRSYSVFALLGFWVASLYRQKMPRPLAMAAALSLLANLTVHGAIVACCFGAAYVWKFCRTGAAWDVSARKAAALFAVSLAFLAVCLWPPRQLVAPVSPPVKKILNRLQRVVWIPVQESTARPVPPAQTGGPGGIPLRQRLRFATVYPVATWTAPALLFEVLVCLYLYRRHAALLILAPLLLCGFLVGFYLKLWHTGLLWVTLAMVLWAVWDDTEPTGRLTLQNAIAVCFALLCVLQLPWTLGAVRYELHHPTYPAEAAAAYVKTFPPGNRLDGYGIAFTLLPYFTRPVFANDVPIMIDPRQAAADNPDEIVIGEVNLTDEVQSELQTGGYRRTKTFCGAEYFPNQVLVPTCLAFLERSRQQTPLQ